MSHYNLSFHKLLFTRASCFTNFSFHELLVYFSLTVAVVAICELQLYFLSLILITWHLTVAKSSVTLEKIDLLFVCHKSLVSSNSSKRG